MKNELAILIKANDYINDYYVNHGTFLEDLRNKQEFLQIYEFLKNSDVESQYYDSIFKIINELDKNVTKHAGLTKGDFYMLELVISDGVIRLSCQDKGIGISKAFEGTNIIKEDALFEALDYGVSATIKNSDDPDFAFSKGYGLYFISKICEPEGNDFSIWSGDYKIIKRENVYSKQRTKYYKGTQILLTLELCQLNENVDLVEKSVANL